LRRFRDYDPFAWLYTKYWGDEYHTQVMPVLDRLVLQYLPPQAAVLDLCCGDGRIAAQLVRRKYRVTGIDGSEQMLSYARQRTSRAEFLLGDARTFKLPLRFHAAISTFDSLNHVMEADELESVFRNVYAVLQEGGSFVFDLNDEEAFRELWARTSTGVTREAVSIAQGDYNPHTGIAVCDITLFRLERNQWNRCDFRLSQKHHPRDKVIDSLQRAGFEAQAFGAGQLGMQGDIGRGRTFFLGTKNRAHSP